MSTTLMSAFYDIDFLCKVRGGARRKEGGQAGSPSRFQTLSSVLSFWGIPPHLDFLGSRKIPKFAVVMFVSCGRGEGAGREEGQEGAAVAVSPEPTAATLPGASRTESAPPRPAAHRLRITCRKPARPGVGVRLLPTRT